MNDIQMKYYRRFRRTISPALEMMIDTSVRNPQLVPEEGPCIIVSNHRSDVDPFLLITNLKRPINFFAGSYLWNIPVFKNLLNNLGAIPVSKFRSEINASFITAEELLKDGQAVCIFPEGWDYICENQFDWSVGKFNTGFARIAAQTGAPVVPIALQGLNELRVPNPLPPFIRKMLDFPFEMQYIKDRCMYRKLHINVGKPIKVPEGLDPKNRESIDKFTEHVNEAVRELYNHIPRDVAGFEEIQPQPAGPPEKDLPEAVISRQEAEDAALEG